MSTHRYPGGVISATPPTVSASGAVGVWTLEEALRNKATGNWPDGSGLDIYFKNTTLLLHADGTNGAQNNTFLDSSTNNFTITRNGNTTQGSFDPYVGPGCWSNYFDGTGDYLSVSNINFSTTNFTIEGWFYPTTIANLTNFWGTNNGSGSNPKMTMYIDSSGNLTLDMGTAGSTQFPVSASASTYLATNAWQHIALVRSSNTVTMYINGVSVSSGSLSTDISTITASFNIGYVGEAYGQMYSGYISNFRIVKGAALYTTAFTPSTTPIVATTQTTLLTCNSNGFNDFSAANKALTRNGDVTVSKFSPFTLYQITPASYTGYFDGTNSYLTAPSNAAFTFGTGDFTIETWVYLTASSASYTLLDMRTAGTSVCILLNFYSGNALNLLVNGSNVIVCSGITANAWHHIALTRSGTSSKIFIDGTQSGSTYTDSNNYASGIPTIGRNSTAGGGTQFFPGSISNLRIVKGQALYTSNFTPSTLPLTTTSQGATAANVSLLTCQSTTFIDNSTNAFTITANGNAQPKIANPFTDTVAGPTAYSGASYGGSAFFDGTGDYLVTTANLTFSTSLFTIEFWVYPLNSATTVLVANNITNGIQLQSSSGNISIGTFGISNTITTSGAPIKTNAWNHIVAVRSGTGTNQASIFVNGVRGVNGTVSTNYVAGPLLVGSAAPTQPLTGYISGLSVTIGTANYSPSSTGFVVPTAPPSPTGTTFCLNATNAGIFDNTTVIDLETSGSAQISTSVVKYGTGSISFNGTNSYLTTRSNLNEFAFGSGNFTIEMWVYFNDVTSSTNIYEGRPAATEGAYPTIYITGSALRWYVSSANRITSSAVSTGQWYHLAVCRSNGSTRMFLNGTQTGSTYIDSTVYLGATNRPIIGCFDGASGFFNGYLDDIRVTKGIARYTTNFTPPTGPFPNI